MEQKNCNTCKTDKPLVEFYFKNKAKGYRDSSCKSCRYEMQKRTIRKPVIDGNKECGNCRKWKPVTEFYVASRNLDGREYFCKSCRWDRKDKIQHKEAVRASLLWCKYGITLQDYDDLIGHSNNKCFICGGSESRRLSIDHCHNTGRVRGLLCNKCNRTLGILEDNVDVLQIMMEYLKNPPAENIIDQI